MLKGHCLKFYQRSRCKVRFLKGTADLGLLYRRSDAKELTGYSDSDWAGDLNDRKSTSGYMFVLSGAPAESRVQLHYFQQRALSSATQEVMYVAYFQS